MVSRTETKVEIRAKPFASHETAVELVLVVEEDVVPPDRAESAVVDAPGEGV